MGMTAVDRPHQASGYNWRRGDSKHWHLVIRIGATSVTTRGVCALEFRRDGPRAQLAAMMGGLLASIWARKTQGLRHRSAEYTKCAPKGPTGRPGIGRKNSSLRPGFFCEILRSCVDLLIQSGASGLMRLVPT